MKMTVYIITILLACLHNSSYANNCNAAEKYIDHDGISFFAKQFGDRSNPTILLIHGYADEQAIWSMQIDRLKQEFHLITFDTRGAGGSSSPDSNEGYKLEEMKGDIDAILSGFCIEDNQSIHLIAHDWGGGLAWQYIDSLVRDNRQNRLKSYTAISAPHLAITFDFVERYKNECFFIICTENAKTAKNQINKSFYADVIVNFPLFPELFLFVGNYPFYYVLSTGNGFSVDDTYLTQRNFLEMSRTSFNGLNLYRQNWESSKHQDLTSFASMQIPIMLIVPEEDIFFEPDIYPYYYNYINNLTLVNIDNGKHWIMRQFPDLISFELKAFIQSNE